MSGRRAKALRNLMYLAGVPMGADDMEWWTRFTQLLPPGADISKGWWQRTLTPYLQEGRTRGKRQDRDWRAKWRSVSSRAVDRARLEASLAEDDPHGTVRVIPEGAYLVVSNGLRAQGF